MWVPAYVLCVSREADRMSELPTYEHAGQVCGVSRFGDELIHGVFGAKRAVQLARNGRQRSIRRLVRRPATHIEPRHATMSRCRGARCRLGRRGALYAFYLELVRCPGREGPSFQRWHESPTRETHQE